MTEFERGWHAALVAAQNWHQDKAKQLLVLARRSRFPKSLEQQSETHRHAAEMMLTISPDGVGSA